MCSKKQVKDYRTELEKKAKIRYVTMSDNAKLRVLDFDLAPKSEEYIIILIPGFATVFQSWQRAMELLTQDFRVYYLESREKNTSILPRKLVRKITMTQMAYDNKEAFNQLFQNNEKFIVICSSTSGNFIAEALSKKWVNPTGTIMVGPQIEFKINLFLLFLAYIIPKFLLRKTLVPLIRWITKHYVDAKKDPEQLNKYVRAFTEADYKKSIPLARRLYKYQIWDLLEDIEAKVLLLGASFDKLHTTENTMRTHDLIKNSIYVDVGTNKAAHSDALVDELKKFMKFLDEENA